MINQTYTDYSGNNWTRVSKRRARALYNAGHTITLVAAYMRPFGAWCLSVPLNISDLHYINDTFDTLVAEYEYFNCNNECGKYAAYYVRTEVLE